MNHIRNKIRKGNRKINYFINNLFGERNELDIER